MTIMGSTYKPLTKYEQASFKELVVVALPLILTAISTGLMLFADRIILSNYSISALNAAVTAGLVCLVFKLAMIGLCGITNVFVGQYNGAKNYIKVSEPVWQMLWFSLFSIIIFLPMANLLGPILVAETYHEEGIPYFYWLMLFVPFVAMNATLIGFFVGRGKTRMVFAVTVLANILNIILDIVFVFGIGSIVPAMGAEGAAIATVSSQVFSAMTLFFVFTNKRNREQFNTGNFTIKWSVMYQCVRVGFPSSMGRLLNISAWAFIFHIMAETSVEHITVFSIGQTVLLLFFLVVEGMHKAVTALSANYIGQNHYGLISQHLWAVARFIGLMAMLSFFPLVVYPNFLLNLFTVLQSQPEQISMFSDAVKSVMTVLWLIFIFDLTGWALLSVLVAAGDTKFVMWTSACVSWFFAVLPIYIYINYFQGTGEGAWLFGLLSAFIAAVIYYLRYSRGNWKTLEIIDRA